MPREDRGELEWNAANYVIRRIGQLGDRIRINYLEMRQNPNHDTYKAYFDTLMALYSEIKRYLDDDEKQEITTTVNNIEGMLESDNAPDKIIQEQLEELDETLNDHLVDVGLDIPSEVSLDEDHAAVGGRQI